MADSSLFERSGWLGTRARPLLHDWEHTRAATQLATQLLGDDETDEGPRDIGREVGNHTRELFVSCDPADALLQQFERLVPAFMAVHDVGTRNARKLLSGISSASGRPMQKLIIRRQGHGTTLATIDFIDCEADAGRTVRMYSTEIDADTVTRVALARSLMAYSQMTVLMVGDLPAHALAAALQPLREAVLKGPWPCRHLLFLPLALSPALTALASDFSIATAIEVKTTPKVTRPAEAWAYLGATWNRSQATDYGPGKALLLQPLKGNAAAPADAPAPQASDPARTMAASSSMVRLDLGAGDAVPPATGAAAVAPAPAYKGLASYLEKLAAVQGVESYCVFDPGRRQTLAHHGHGAGLDVWLAQGMSQWAAVAASGRALGLGGQVAELTVTLAHHCVLLRALPGFADLVIQVVVAKPASNLTMVRLAMQKMDAVVMASTSPLPSSPA